MQAATVYGQCLVFCAVVCQCCFGDRRSIRPLKACSI